MFKFIKLFQNIKKNKSLDNSYKSILKIENKIILINSHSNLNFTAGDTIMISNYMNLLMKNNNFIYLLSIYEVGQNFKRNLEFENYKILKSDNNKKLIKLIDSLSTIVNIIFIRNHLIINELDNKNYSPKIIFYGLTYHLKDIKKLKNYLGIITQSKQLRKLYIKSGVSPKKIKIIEPFAYKYDFNLIKKKKDKIKLIYCGTLRKEENLFKLINEFKKIYKAKPEILLKIIYGKIHGDINFQKKINNLIENNVNGIIFKHNLSHRDTCFEIASSDYGIFMRKNIRKNKIGLIYNGEISTKLKEYKLYKTKVINNLLVLK